MKTFATVTLFLGLMSSAACWAHSGSRSCTYSPHTDRLCIGDVVGYKYNFAVGTVVAVYQGGYADVDWNIAGSGFGRHLSTFDLLPKNRTERPGGYVTDYHGQALQSGDVVSYRYNEAIGTVDRVYADSQTVDVNWNIRGSGYGRQLPATDVIKNKNDGGQDYYGRVLDARGVPIYVGSVVGYKYNYAVGTVDAVFSDGTVNVNWNIQGSGYGLRLPSTDVFVK